MRDYESYFDKEKSNNRRDIEELYRIIHIPENNKESFKKIKIPESIKTNEPKNTRAEEYFRNAQKSLDEDGLDVNSYQRFGCWVRAYGFGRGLRLFDDSIRKSPIVQNDMFEDPSTLKDYAVVIRPSGTTVKSRNQFTQFLASGYAKPVIYKN
ncbi:MAG: hypothetical protein HYW24_00485 [Candidatus Aenigmarchaeota archaeon]|nr:hypothetical protein [Candidatus Aenigmarchaeota archaeon]